MAVVGIDLGTTNTVIAAVRDGRATSLKDKTGRALLPSVVSFGPKPPAKVGYPAKDRRTIDPENTVFSIKRLIGRTFDSEPVQKSIPRYPFRLKEGPGKSTMVSCYEQDHTLPEISALVLQEAVAIAEHRLGERVSDAVITVPANFNDLQRAATKIAGRTAGLEVLRIINEPTAAALAYGFGKTGRERIVVYDFGGGTFDVTLLDLHDNVFEVLATAGDTFLGGDDIDRAIMDRMAEVLLREQKVDAERDILVREQLRVAAEHLKVELSTRSMAKTRIEDLEFEFPMRRSEFEAMAEPLMAKTLAVCQEALDIAGLFVKDLDQVLLVGGSTRIPLVRRRVSSFFAKMPQSRINPDEVVAIGAAIQAASLEAKLGPSLLPAAPRPRSTATSTPSPAERTLTATRSGLAGLRNSLSPAAGDAARPGSVLSALKPGLSSVNPQASAQPTITGVGQARPSLPALRSSLSNAPLPTAPLSAAPLPATAPEDKPFEDDYEASQRTRGNTNLGLGQAPDAPPAELGAAPPRAVTPAPPAATAPTATAPTAKRTVPGLRAAAPASPPAPAQELSFQEQMDALSAASDDQLEDGDGSVRFDLDDLEAQAASTAALPRLAEARSDLEVDEFGEEPTQVFDRVLRPPTADVAVKPPPQKPPQRTRTSPGGMVVDPALPAALAPGPLHAPVEELSNSALFSLQDEDEDLPAPPAAARTSADSDLLAMQMLAEENDDELDLPSPAWSQTATSAEADVEGQRDSDLPLPVVRADEADLPSYRTSHGVERRAQAHDVDLPAVGTIPGLPVVGRAVGLPGLGPAAAPPVRSTAAHLPQAVTQPGLPAPRGLPGVTDPGRTALGVAPPAPRPGAAVSPQPPTGAQHVQPTDEEPTHRLRSQAPMLEVDDELAEDGPNSPARTTGPFATAAYPIATTGPTAPYGRAALPASPLLLDVTPLSLGVEVVGGYVDRLIERNSPVPCARTRTFATASDNQSQVVVRVSQGEQGRFEENTVLGEVLLSGIRRGPRGSVKIDVSFSLDESGMLQVSARDPTTGAAANAQLMLVGVQS